jgi:hypothetical protein
MIKNGPMKLDSICWMTDEGYEWLKEDVELLTPEVVRDYVARTKSYAESVIEGWRRNGVEATLDIYVEFGALLKPYLQKQKDEIEDTLQELGL